MLYIYVCIYNCIYIFIYIYVYIHIKGVARGKEGKSPSPNWKYCCRKMMLFPKALFLVTNFRKNINIKKQKINFLIEFSSRNFEILSKFPNFRFFFKLAKG